MLVRNKTGLDPAKMTYVRFKGILHRLSKLRRWEPGATVTREEMIAERMGEMAAARQEDD